MREDIKVYYVSRNNCTAAEPQVGYYVSYMDSDNEPCIRGPFIRIETLSNFLEEIENGFDRC